MYFSLLPYVMCFTSGPCLLYIVLQVPACSVSTSDPCLTGRTWSVLYFRSLPIIFYTSGHCLFLFRVLLQVPVYSVFCFRSLPNWKNLKCGSEEDQEEMSEDDLRAMNCKESSILTSNLSSTDALIPQQEVISDVIQLKALGNMVESLVSTRSIIVEKEWMFYYSDLRNINISRDSNNRNLRQQFLHYMWSTKLSKLTIRCSRGFLFTCKFLTRKCDFSGYMYGKFPHFTRQWNGECDAKSNSNFRVWCSMWK